jgi:hypothetical protein
MTRRPPLLSFPGIEMRSATSFINPQPPSGHDDSDTPRKRSWYHYLPLCGTSVIIFQNKDLQLPRLKEL